MGAAAATYADPEARALRVVLAGAALGNGNRGVEALSRSVINAVHAEDARSRVSVLDDGWGVRGDETSHHDGARVELVGVRRSRRWHRPESWAQIRAAQATIPRINPVARRFERADAVLDLSAGDSFTDLYGPFRLSVVTAPKEAALRAGRPLILLPQTFGPFVSPQARRVAERLVRSAEVAYARDLASLDELRALAGPDADPTRLRSGVDVAFALTPRRPREEVADRIDGLAHDLTAGVNVSGLLVGPDAADQFGLEGDYLDTMTGLVRGLLSRGAHVVLVPHVHVPGGGGESDIAAIDEVCARLSESERSRTTVLPTDLDAAELKWCIAALDWFVGSRMHATIGALSTLTPVAAYAYSDKTLGVFETCGVADRVLDARTHTGPELVDALLTQFEERDLTRQRLSRTMPDTIRASHSQLEEVLALVRACPPPPATPGRHRG